MDSMIKDILTGDAQYKILDIGTGRGDFLSDQLNLIKSQSMIVCSDINIEFLKSLRSKLNHHHCIFIVMDGMNICFKSDFFDVIIANQVIEHVKDDVAMIRECFRVSKESAYFYVSSVLKSKNTFYIYRNKKSKKMVLHTEHVREYRSVFELRNALENIGFEIIDERITPFKWPLFGLCIRLLKRLGIIGPVTLVWSIKKNHFLRLLYKILLIRIPGYHKLEFLTRKNGRYK
jgi:ubiquinone/menaquinone biosynthesis C-methylase UbiE